MLVISNLQKTRFSAFSSLHPGFGILRRSMESATTQPPEGQPRKEASSLSKDGMWRSFTRVPHLLQYVSSATYYARAKTRGKDFN
jgi:hypothetical protein